MQGKYVTRSIGESSGYSTVEAKPSSHRFSGTHLFPLVLIALAGSLPYLNTLDNSFVFDDEESIALNPLIRNLSNFLPGEAGWKAYPTRIIGYVSFALNYRIGGLEVSGYHAVNISIHIVSSILVYLIVFLAQKSPRLRRLSEEPASKGLPLITALLFAVHPVQTEAVSYIVQRLASLAALYFMGSLAAYILGRMASENDSIATGRRSLGWYLVSWICALLAMKTKEIAFTLPAIVFLFEGLFFEGKWRNRLLRVFPYLLIALVIPLSLIRLDHPLERILSDTSDVSRLQTDLSRTVYLFTQFRVIVTYLRLIVLPLNLNLDYDYPVYSNLFDPAVLLSLFLIVFLVGSAVLLIARSAAENNAKMRLMAFGVFWFFTTISVESSVLPIRDVIFEHRLYLPSVGAFLTVVSLAFLALERIPLKCREPWGVILLGGILLSLAIGTYQRNHIWQNNVTLWEDVVRKSPWKARPRYNLGTAYSVRGRTKEAINQYIISIRLRPNFPEAWDNLGIDYAKIGLITKAIEAHEKAASIDPTFPQPYFNLGQIYMSALPGKEAEAARLFRKAIALKPDYIEAWVNLSAVSVQSGHYHDGARAAERAVSLAPDRPDGHYNLAVARFMQGDRNGAMISLGTVKELDPGMGDSLERFFAISSR